MKILNFRLRTKSLLAVIAACFMALVPTVLTGLEVFESGRQHFGRAFAKNFTLLNTRTIEAPVN